MKYEQLVSYSAYKSQMRLEMFYFIKMKTFRI